MGFLDRRTGHLRRAADRYTPRPGARNAGSGEVLFDPTWPRRAAGPADRPDLSTILGRSVLEARTQQICRAYGLIPRSGPATGSGLSRSYLARDAGVEIAADAHGVVTTVFLHFHGDDGFTSFHGEIPGGAGTVPRRAALWAALGRPEASGDPYTDRFLGDFGPWDRWPVAGFVLHAQYALDGENLHRITLTVPDRSTLRAA
jgi:hypothetical protein